MKITKLSTFLFAAGIVFMGTVQAHDPSEHKSKMEKPKCEAQKDMDHSKMDANDPIMMAMMKKCMKKHPAESSQGEGGERNHTNGDKKKGVCAHFLEKFTLTLQAPISEALCNAVEKWIGLPIRTTGAFEQKITVSRLVSRS